jgi:DNA-directed RNA polymerase specialized sigma24 family protein
VTEYYNDFVNFAKQMGEKQYPEDIVQELYIHINEKKVTKSYCLTWIQWRVLDLHRLNKKIQKVEVPEIISHDTDFEIDLMKDVHWFHKGIFDLWADGMSIREINKRTNISIGTIRVSIDKIKEVWRERKDK